MTALIDYALAHGWEDDDLAALDLEANVVEDELGLAEVPLDAFELHNRVGGSTGYALNG